MNICSFGCDQPAIKLFKSGNFCCSVSTSKCPAQKAKNGAGVKKFISKFDDPNKRWKNGHPKGMTGKEPSIKGCTFDEFYGTRAEDIKAKHKNACQGRTPVKHTEETKKRLSEVARDRNLGGYVKGSGRGKKGWCRGFFCDSSWELAFVLYHTDHGNEIARCNKPRIYEFDGKIKKYFPDFIVGGVTYEIKGYRTQQWDAKAKANPDVIALFEKDLKPIFTYVISQYGKDFISLYE